MLEDCSSVLKECIKMISQPNFYKENTIQQRMRQLKQQAKLKLQLCAILSQVQNHHEAQKNARQSV